MSNEEAIEVLKAAKGYIKYGGIAEAADVAISALEKQIPKKPEYSSDGYAPDGAEVWDAHCPNCEHELDIEDICPNCGQAIDWSDSE